MQNNDSIICSAGLISNSNSVIKVMTPVNIEWKPKEDITTYELARCLPLLMVMQSNYIMPDMYDLSDSWMRHFEINDPNLTK